MTGQQSISQRQRSEALKIICFATVAAILYGILHDLITAHLCVEYFTIAHPRVFPTESPLLLAIGWGVIATWWVGLGLGIALALAARAGSAPRLSLADLRPSIVKLLVTVTLVASSSGAIGAVLLEWRVMAIPHPWAAAIPPERHVAFAAVASAHFASYIAAALGGLFLIIRTARRRRSQCLGQASGARGVKRDHQVPDSLRQAQILPGHEALLRWWDAERAGIQTRCVSAQEIQQLEEHYSLTLPDSFRDYLTHASPVDDPSWDNELTNWWPFTSLKTVADGYESPLSGELAAYRDKLILFADFSIWCCAWAINCAPGDDYGKVAVIAGPDRFVAESFDDFISKYITDVSKVWP